MDVKFPARSAPMNGRTICEHKTLLTTAGNIYSPCQHTPRAGVGYNSGFSVALCIESAGNSLTEIIPRESVILEMNFTETEHRVMNEHSPELC